jgi:hypothetical protein
MNRARLSQLVLTFAALMLLSSCAELRSGWVKVDFMGQAPAPEVVCEVTRDKDGDLEMQCADLRLVATQLMKSLKKPVPPGDL